MNIFSKRRQIFKSLGICRIKNVGSLFFEMVNIYKMLVFVDIWKIHYCIICMVFVGITLYDCMHADCRTDASLLFWVHHLDSSWIRMGNFCIVLKYVGMCLILFNKTKKLNKNIYRNVFIIYKVLLDCL